MMKKFDYYISKGLGSKHIKKTQDIFLKSSNLVLNKIIEENTMKQIILCKTCRSLMKVTIGEGRKAVIKQTCLVAPVFLGNLKKSQTDGGYPAITECTHHSV